MRPALIYPLLAVCLLFATSAYAISRFPSGLTVILDFRGIHSDSSILEMERESGSILKTTGLKLDWRLRDDASKSAYPNLVVMTFNGTCKFEPTPQPYDEPGPLASTTMTNHAIQPFGQVDCDHVVGTARSAMFGADYAHADLLVGRALGRVVVHEIVHMLTHSAEHGHDGVFEAALSGKQLIAPSLPLSAMDVDRLMSVMSGYESEQQ
jgi:hypothetical protein